jgi:ribosomal protein uL22
MKYAYQKGTENTAKAAMKSVRISSKVAIEMCNYLRYKDLGKAKMLIEEVAHKTKALPFKRFHNGLGHKPGMMSGRYPEKACIEFTTLLNMVEANAKNLSLGDKLKIVHLAAHRGSNEFRFGRRQRRQQRKNTHLEIVVKEVKEKKVAKPAKEPKPEVKETKEKPKEEKQ